MLIDEQPSRLIHEGRIGLSILRRLNDDRIAFNLDDLVPRHELRGFSPSVLNADACRFRIGICKPYNEIVETWGGNLPRPSGWAVSETQRTRRSDTLFRLQFPLFRHGNLLIPAQRGQGTARKSRRALT